MKVVFICVIKMCSIVFQTVTTCSSFVGGYRLEVRRLDGVTTEDHSPHFHSYCAVWAPFLFHKPILLTFTKAFSKSVNSHLSALVISLLIYYCSFINSLYPWYRCVRPRSLIFTTLSNDRSLDSFYITIQDVRLVLFLVGLCPTKEAWVTS